MWDCWQQNPDKRPTFAELTATFLRLISLQQVKCKIVKENHINVGEMKCDYFENIKLN